ncbi:MAG TPA: hypothetical protein VH083_25580 [Myxococcales bacterium]|nr:hypothetical protein [Myxococcales bacterium]
MTQAGSESYFHGGIFSGSGASVDFSSPSPDEKWIALLTFTADDAPHPETGGLFSGGQPQPGWYYVDILEVATRRRIATYRQHGERGELGDDGWYWAGSHYFVLPFPGRSEALIAHLP